MPILVLDPTCEAQLRQLWPGLDDDRLTEVWEGVTVMSPAANNDHQNLVNALGGVFWLVIESAGRGRVLQGVNLSDRTPNWLDNYRNPDVAAYLNGNPAVTGPSRAHRTACIVLVREQLGHLNRSAAAVRVRGFRRGNGGHGNGQRGHAVQFSGPSRI